MVVIRCPRCNTKTNLSLKEPTYEGPFRCWKCRGTFIVAIEGEEPKFCKPISEDEFEKIQQ